MSAHQQVCGPRGVLPWQPLLRRRAALDRTRLARSAVLLGYRPAPRVPQETLNPAALPLQRVWRAGAPNMGGKAVSPLSPDPGTSPARRHQELGACRLMGWSREMTLVQQVPAVCSQATGPGACVSTRAVSGLEKGSPAGKALHAGQVGGRQGRRSWADRGGQQMASDGQVQAPSGRTGHPGSLALGLALPWLVRRTWWGRHSAPLGGLVGGHPETENGGGGRQTVTELSVSPCHCRAIPSATSSHPHPPKPPPRLPPFERLLQPGPPQPAPLPMLPSQGPRVTFTPQTQHRSQGTPARGTPL